MKPLTLTALIICSPRPDDDDGSMPEGKFIGSYATWGWDEWRGFPLPSSHTIMAEQLVQVRYTVDW